MITYFLYFYRFIKKNISIFHHLSTHQSILHDHKDVLSIILDYRNPKYADGGLYPAGAAMTPGE